MASYTCKQVDKMAQVPASEGYSRLIPSQGVTDIVCAAGVGSMVRGSGQLMFYYTGDGSKAWSVKDAVSFRVERYARTIDGQWLDARFSFDASGDGKGGTLSGWPSTIKPGFLCVRYGNGTSLFAWGSWKLHTDTGDTDANSSSYVTGIKVATRVTLLKAGTGEPFTFAEGNGMAFAVADLDQTGGKTLYGSYREAVKLVSGVEPVLYCGTTTILNVPGANAVKNGGFESCETNGWVAPVQEGDDGTWRSTVLFYVKGPTFELEWTGFSCVTEFQQLYRAFPDIPEREYPSVRKLVAAAGAREVAAESATARRGDEVGWSLTVRVPYVAGVAAATAIELTDTFDDRIDVTGAAVAVTKLADSATAEEADDTAAWDPAWEGQTLTLSALEPADVGGTYRVLVSGTRVLRDCPVGELENRGTLAVQSKDTDQGTLTAESNVVTVSVSPRFSVLRVTKETERGEWQEPFGQPAFPVVVAGTTIDGLPVERWVVLAPEPGSSQTAEAPVADLAGPLTATEVPAARWELVSVEGSSAGFSATGATATFDLDAMEGDSDVLCVTFANRPLRPDGPSHAAQAVNVVE